MYDTETKTYVCDVCTAGTGSFNRDQTGRVMVANILVAEACQSCQRMVIDHIKQLRTAAADAWYEELERPVPDAKIAQALNVKRFGPITGS